MRGNAVQYADPWYTWRHTDTGRLRAHRRTRAACRCRNPSLTTGQFDQSVFDLSENTYPVCFLMTRPTSFIRLIPGSPGRQPLFQKGSRAYRSHRRQGDWQFDCIWRIDPLRPCRSRESVRAPPSPSLVPRAQQGALPHTHERDAQEVEQRKEEGGLGRGQECAPLAHPGSRAQAPSPHRSAESSRSA